MEQLDLFDPRESIATHYAEIIRALGLPVNSEGLSDTPKRVAKFLMEFNQKPNYDEILGSVFEHVGPDSNATRAMVAQTEIPFRGLCEHHFLPFFGKAHIGYIPKDRVVGLSKLTRLVQAVGTARPSIQETITNEIADILTSRLDPLGVMVVVSAEHTCMAVRGINAPGVVTTTSAVRGVFMQVPAARQEFLSFIKGGR